MFLFLILAQGVHSIEEYATRLYEVFGPARFVSGLISHDLALGFLVFNAALVTFGSWCWAIPVRSGWRTASAFVWFWTVLELGTSSTRLLPCRDAAASLAWRPLRCCYCSLGSQIGGPDYPEH